MVGIEALGVVDPERADAGGGRGRGPGSLELGRISRGVVREVREADAAQLAAGGPGDGGVIGGEEDARGVLSGTAMFVHQ